MDPTFTVLVPAHNAAGTIESALRSVLAQSRQDVEVIVVDDGSSDDTGERAAAFRDSRVILVSQENGGSSAALNTGIARARGTFVSRLDADDLLLPTYLEEMERALAAAPDAGFAYTDAWILEGRSRRVSRVTAMASEHPPLPPPATAAEFLAELLARNFVFTATTMRRSALEAVGPFNTSLRNAQDYEMWLRFAARGFRGVRVPELLAVYRRAPGSLSTNLVGVATAKLQIYRRFAEEHDVPERARALARHRMTETEAELAALRRFHARRRWVPTRLRRLLGRGYRAVRYRGAWYDVAPPEVAAAFPDLRTV